MFTNEASVAFIHWNHRTVALSSAVVLGNVILMYARSKHRDNAPPVRIIHSVPSPVIRKFAAGLATEGDQQSWIRGRL